MTILMFSLAVITSEIFEIEMCTTSTLTLPTAMEKSKHAHWKPVYDFLVDGNRNVRLYYHRLLDDHVWTSQMHSILNFNIQKADKSNLTTGAAPVEANLQEELSDSLQFWSRRCRSMSHSTTFAMFPFAGEYKIYRSPIWHFCSRSHSFQDINIWRILHWKIGQTDGVLLSKWCHSVDKNKIP